MTDKLKFPLDAVLDISKLRYLSEYLHVYINENPSNYEWYMDIPGVMDDYNRCLRGWNESYNWLVDNGIINKL